LLDNAPSDPLLGALPARCEAFQWHHYTYGVPAGAVELARSDVCTQAFRLGDAVWGIQFHAEVTLPQILGWIDEAGHELEGTPEELIAETEQKIAGWNDLGRRLCGGFLEVAERVGAPA
jgi:GMP synthase (glutamine-hydrolysing)